MARQKINLGRNWYAIHVVNGFEEAVAEAILKRAKAFDLEDKIFNAIVPKEKIEEINPKGGFPHYGVIRNDAVIVKGSVPGPIKRLIRMRRAIRKADKIVNDLNTTVII